MIKKKDSNKIRRIIFYFITDGPWAKVESRKVLYLLFADESTRTKTS